MKESGAVAAGGASIWSSDDQGISALFLVYLSLISLCLLACRGLEGIKMSVENENEASSLKRSSSANDDTPVASANLTPKRDNAAVFVGDAIDQRRKSSSRFKHRLFSLISSFLPEAGLVILIGVLAGYALCTIMPPPSPNSTSGDGDGDGDGDASEPIIESTLLTFSSTTFFLFLLPPIIFNCGFHMNRTLFFPLFPAISLFAIVGTIISTAVVGSSLFILSSAGFTGTFKPTLPETLAFGALISATDPVSTLSVFQAKRVDPLLFYLVFGESVMNDAAALVLYETMAKFVGEKPDLGMIAQAVLEFIVVFFCSTLLGVICGIVSSFVTCRVDMRPTPLLESSLFILIVYTPFFTAEVLGLSGIVTILFTAITVKCYASKNLSPETRELMDGIFRLLAHICETAIFLELGLSVFGMSSVDNYHWRFVLWTVVFCLLGRSVNVYPLSFVVNVCGLVGPSNGSAGGIPRKTQHMLFLSGLRGAVAFACATTFPNDHGNRDAFVVTTMAVVLVTVFVMGGGTETALDVLGIKTGVVEEEFCAKMSTFSDVNNPASSSCARRSFSFFHSYFSSWFVRDYEEYFRDEPIRPGTFEIPELRTAASETQSLMSDGRYAIYDYATPVPPRTGMLSTRSTATTNTLADEGSVFSCVEVTPGPGNGAMGHVRVVNRRLSLSAKNIFDFGAKKKRSRMRNADDANDSNAMSIRSV